jgi:hypothetical protein
VVQRGFLKLVFNKVSNNSFFANLVFESTIYQLPKNKSEKVKGKLFVTKFLELHIMTWQQLLIMKQKHICLRQKEAEQ